MVRFSPWLGLLAGSLFMAFGPTGGATAGEAAFPGATWGSQSPADVGLDARSLQAFSDFARGRGCVVRHGFLAYSWGDPAKRGDVASACKPFFSHFLFKALEDGKIKGLDDQVRALEPRLAFLNPLLQFKDTLITWRHLATQTSCYGVQEQPGTAFDYNDWQMALFWDLLFLKAYGATCETVDEKVFRPLLADPLQCQDEPTMMAFGTRDRPGRVAISPRDFCRFGLLYLRKGNWNGKQLLRAEHAAMAVSSPLPASIPRTAGRAAEMLDGQRTLGSDRLPDNQCDHLGSYSFLWWTNGVDDNGLRHWRDVPPDTYGAFGHGGKRAMVVIPSLDLIASWNDTPIEGRDAESQALRLLVESAKSR
jgi:CubicO group peptidase (beta-lactamase class C family)